MYYTSFVKCFLRTLEEFNLISILFADMMSQSAFPKNRVIPAISNLCLSCLIKFYLHTYLFTYLLTLKVLSEITSEVSVAMPRSMLVAVGAMASASVQLTFM